MMIGLLALFINIVVGVELYNQFSTHIEEEFKPHVAVFEKHYGKKLKGIGIKFEDLSSEGTAVGICYLLTGNIGIDKSYWEYADDLEREQLILHELGHCVLGLSHNTEMTGSCPESLMYPSLIPHCYKKSREYYIKELFDNYPR